MADSVRVVKLQGHYGRLLDRYLERVERAAQDSSDGLYSPTRWMSNAYASWNDLVSAMVFPVQFASGLKIDETAKAAGAHHHEEVVDDGCRPPIDAVGAQAIDQWHELAEIARRERGAIDFAEPIVDVCEEAPAGTIESGKAKKNVPCCIDVSVHSYVAPGTYKCFVASKCRMNRATLSTCFAGVVFVHDSYFTPRLFTCLVQKSLSEAKM